MGRANSPRPRCREKPDVSVALMTVPQTDTRRWGEDPKAHELMLAKELGKMAPYLR